ncbi:MAG TPA: hypothetical protein DCG48_06240 [Rhodospirillaceae bacterium]|nr:hypothetical protein [Rhodospirillaceae bacterium]|tara:strand:+ start:440 stop:862 length:423 start_codon:yes stop_codon:yes gene_type:complete
MMKMNGTSRSISGMRRVCAALLAIAVLFTGVGMSHATMATDHSASVAAHGGHHATTDMPAHHQKECDGPAHAVDVDPASPQKHGAMHGCCASACFPSFTNPEITFVPVRSVIMERLTPRADQAAASRSLDAMFKPPRRIL